MQGRQAYASVRRAQCLQKRVRAFALPLDCRWCPCASPLFFMYSAAGCHRTPMGPQPRQTARLEAETWRGARAVSAAPTESCLLAAAGPATRAGRRLEKNRP